MRHVTNNNFPDKKFPIYLNYQWLRYYTVIDIFRQLVVYKDDSSYLYLNQLLQMTLYERNY